LDIYHIDWCRISSISSILKSYEKFMELPSTSCKTHIYIDAKQESETLNFSGWKYTLVPAISVVDLSAIPLPAAYAASTRSGRGIKASSIAPSGFQLLGQSTAKEAARKIR